MQDLNEAPLFQALVEKVNKEEARFYVPGHKGGYVFPGHGRKMYHPVLKLDLTELDGLDNLHDPQGVIRQAQELAARQFGADQTYFLVNGSTVGNLAMILGCLHQGDVALVQRNSHQSVFHGLSMAGACCFPLLPEVCPRFRVAQGIRPEQIEAALRRCPEAKAVILTYPTYYGWAGADQFEAVVRTAREYGLLVLVDEAHGAHFGQYGSLPPSALQLGADLCVQSTHKMLGSMTMTSMLHIRRGRVPVEDVEDCLRRLQTSSPSYPLLASLDLARLFLSQMTRTDWEQALAAVQELHSGIRALGNYLISSGTGREQDPFKLVIQPVFGLSGFQLQEALRQHGIEVELADPYNVCLTLPLVPHPDWNNRLLQALSSIAKEAGHLQREKGRPGKTPLGHQPGEKGAGADMAELFNQAEPAPIPMRVYRAQEKEHVPLSQAVGRQAAEMITPYPPGIPLLIPGEVIKEEHVSHILRLNQAGAYFPGKQGREWPSVAVVKKNEK
ncbi:Orn/Lys/Arg decarboxylase major region [Caldalkalibacillus thermarum TA2.A1]|uniref:Orn/Lys/Arg decarboxylase major region n=2 Tax=Caldalkalibacillus thermarum (strain TA2.A1) TaxID=986075 RepID=F5L9W9_CALTT|nr:aminotransferase class V-fold PLP-dependent enzyme [Caldalkalibacillus thermarum]EGL81839.1 Orn/Lys/Arg decarboxylase major region [Caldalkalibacillus thermarum TA2.A1]